MINQQIQAKKKARRKLNEIKKSKKRVLKDVDLFARKEILITDLFKQHVKEIQKSNSIIALALIPVLASANTSSSATVSNGTKRVAKCNKIEVRPSGLDFIQNKKRRINFEKKQVDTAWEY
jgi:predicted ATP-grasp superfamily ATP-dependent carboligase